MTPAPVSIALAAETVLADHPLHTAIPFFTPSLLVAGVIVAIMVRDRRRSRDETRETDDEEGP